MNEEYYEESHAEYQEPENRLPEWLKDSPYWLIAVLVHVVFLLIAATIVGFEKSLEEEQARTIVRRETKREEYDPNKKRDIDRKPEILKPQEKNPLLQLKPDKISKTPKGTDLNNKTNKNLSNTSIDDAIGTSGAGAGAYGNRFGRGSLNREGGSEATESAVLAALHWLRRHQNPDGSWSSSDFLSKCDSQKYGAICTHADATKAYEERGVGFEGYDIGVTGLAMLAYLGYGHTHKDGEYPEFREVMKKAMNWMLKQQVKSGDEKTKGLFGAPSEAVDEWVYNHAIASMAMAELLVMSQDKIRLARPVSSAAEWILSAQNPGTKTARLGWKYGYVDGYNDTSVSGWMVLALKAIKACSALKLIKLSPEDYKQSIDGAIAWIESCTGSRSGKTGYQSPGDEGSKLLSFYGDEYPFSKDLSCMTAVGVLCRLFAGQTRREDKLKMGVDLLMEELPEWTPQTGRRQSKINMYYWYYATYALFQFGGTKWKDWNEAMIEALVRNQRVGGCEDGSWDPIGEWGAAGGRVYATAIGAMTLEVYYRYVRAQ